jgi:hypothetical protein
VLSCLSSPAGRPARGACLQIQRRLLRLDTLAGAMLVAADVELSADRWI